MSDATQRGRRETNKLAVMTNVTTVKSRLLIPVRTRFHEGPANDLILNVAPGGVNQSDERSEKSRKGVL